jgi:heterodisulfide reductase subunit A-like polyferredoxin
MYCTLFLSVCKSFSRIKIRCLAPLGERGVNMAHQVVIVGGGLSGVIAAGVLLDRRVDVLIVEKARSVGGRMATRRIDEGKAF